MPLDFSALVASPRLLLEAELQPVQGRRFQPTGFPNLGAAVYRAPGSPGDAVLVESAQSIANRLETVCWDEPADDWVKPLRGLPVVKVVDAQGRPLTNSILEAHRLNSTYIENTAWFDTLKTEIDYADNGGRPLDMRKVYKAVLKFDPNSLIHGFFLESIAGVIRSPRALSGFIEAEEAHVAASGGVKNDRVDPTGKIFGGGAASGQGNVPFSRDEYTARTIKAYFNLDIALIRAMGLGTTAEQLLIGLSLFKIMKFLHEGLRLRTACDLGVLAVSATRPTGFVLPDLSELEGVMPDLIASVGHEGRFADPPVIEVTCTLACKAG